MGSNVVSAKRANAVCSAGKIILIVAWIFLFVDGEGISRWQDFLICGLGGIVCILLDSQENVRLSKKDCHTAAAFCLLFSVAMVLSNYRIFLPIRRAASLVKLALVVAGSFVIGWSIFTLALKRLPLHFSVPSYSQERPVRFFFLCFAATAAVYWVYLFFAAYPGYFTQDTKSAFNNILSHSYDRSIPVYYTLLIKLCLNIGYFFGGSGNSALVVYSLLQTTAMALSFAYAMVTLYEKGVPRWCLAAVWMIYSLLSYNVACSVMIWKDIPFSVAAFVIGVSTYRIVDGIGNRRGNLVVFAISSIIFCLSRTNGWYSFLALTLIWLVLLRMRQKALLAIAVTVVAAGWVLLGPVLDQITSSRTDYLEIMSTPLQQVSRIIWSDYDIPQEDEELLSQVLDLEMVAEQYNPGLVDPIKFNCFDRSRYDFFMENLGQYAALWVRWGLRYPGDYLKAWIDVTKGYWGFGLEYWDYYDFGVAEFEPLGFTRLAFNNPLALRFEKIFGAQEWSTPFRIFYCVGMQAWLVVGCMVLSAQKKRREYLIGLPSLVVLVGLFLCTPGNCLFRYAYVVAMTMPFLLCLTAFSAVQEEEPR